MASNATKKEESNEHDSGIARVRERTIILGDTLIAIDNIGSIQILDVKRNWGLARLGAVIALLGVGAMAVPAAGGAVLGMIIIALGLVMIIANVMQPLRKGLAIGSGDGRLSYIVSENHAFLHRLLEVLTQKINTRNEGLTAVVDITNTTVNISGGAVAIGNNAIATGVDNSITSTDNSINSGGGGVALAANSVASGAGAQTVGQGGAITNNALATAAAPPAPPPPAPPPPAPPPPAPAAAAPLDPDEALFADDPIPTPPQAPPQAPKPRAEPPAPPQVVAAARARPRDPLLDGPEVAPKSDDWLSAPARTDYRPEKEGSARWLLPLVLLLLVGGGGFAGWYFYSQSQTSTSVSLMAPPEAAPAADTQADAAPALPLEPAESTSVETPPALPESIVTDPALPAPDVIVPVPAIAPGDVSSFAPPETIVARASGLRYRASPSSADNVQIIAETRAGGEALLVNGRITQSDGEWYRVAMPDGRQAWFKASLTVPRSRFAETFNAGPAQATSFAAASPRILEPAEGVQLPGGPQPVRLAWQGPADASIYFVEIETYDTITKRWIEDPPHKRVTVERMDELAEAIPRTGAWRWRVRAVSPAGEQSQFSRWSAFGIRD